jgi:hypothetical protein
MLKGSPQVLGLASLLLVAACDHIPLYNESLDWFSWSRYDPEVNAIVSEIPPPGDLEAGPASGHDAMMGDPSAGAASGATMSGAARPAPVAGSATMTTSIGGTTSAGSSASSTSAPLVGIRNSVGPSVTWRSTRGTP